MKQKRFTGEQKAFALRQAESGVPVAAILEREKGSLMVLAIK